MKISLTEILRVAITNDASDIHLQVGAVPKLRLCGELQDFADSEILSAAEIDTFRKVLSNNVSLSAGRSNTSNLHPDFSYTDPLSKRRLRVNAFTSYRGDSLAIRLIPPTVRSLADIGAPAVLAELAEMPRGLVLVTGPTGSGKSATIAAAIHHINQERRAHILTLEDPIEYVHENINCLVSQREIHTHARGYASALKDALREDPDVIVVGEMRDPETIRLAITAAETGHLVLATLHTRSGPQAIDRIIDTFPGAEKGAVRAMLAESLRGIIAQQLVRHRQKTERLAVFEVLLNTPAIKNCIKDSQTGQVQGLMSTCRDIGMITMDQALDRKIKSGEINRDEAARVAFDAKTFR